MPFADFSSSLRDLLGAEVQENGKPLTYRVLTVNALMQPYPDEAGLSGEEKLRRFRLADKIMKSQPVHLSAEEVVLLKTVVAKFGAPLAVGRIYDLIDPSEPTGAVEAP